MDKKRENAMAAHLAAQRELNLAALKAEQTAGLMAVCSAVHLAAPWETYSAAMWAGY